MEHAILNLFVETLHTSFNQYIFFSTQHKKREKKMNDNFGCCLIVTPKVVEFFISKESFSHDFKFLFFFCFFS
jgi:hypothetical protein